MSSSSDHPGHVTQLLERWGRGDESALDELTPLVYSELRNVADAYLRRERPDHTLQATALVIDEALGRIEDGTYGQCSRCGKPLDEERLKAMPTAKYDAECQAAIEVGQGMETPSL